jgi:hypothetical protein
MRVRARVSAAGRPVRHAVVRLRGAGFRRQARRTDRHGAVVFRVRGHRNVRATVSSPACGARLAVSARHAPR